MSLTFLHTFASSSEDKQLLVHLKDTICLTPFYSSLCISLVSLAVKWVTYWLTPSSLYWLSSNYSLSSLPQNSSLHWLTISDFRLLVMIESGLIWPWFGLDFGALSSCPGGELVGLETCFPGGPAWGLQPVDLQLFICFFTRNLWHILPVFSHVSFFW